MLWLPIATEKYYPTVVWLDLQLCKPVVCLKVHSQTSVIFLFSSHHNSNTSHVHKDGFEEHQIYNLI